MQPKIAIEYWLDDGWYVGRIIGIDGIFSQARRLKELKRNLIDALVQIELK